MKLIIYFTSLMCFLSCNRAADNTSVTGRSTELTLPQVFSYNGRNPQLGSADHLDLVINWNKKRSELDSQLGELISDTLTLHLEDGMELILDKNSAITFYKSNYDQYLSQNIIMNAAIPVDYSDIGHSWVYSWVYRQIETVPGGKKTDYLHEDYRILNGRIREIYQFRRAAPRQN